MQTLYREFKRELKLLRERLLAEDNPAELIAEYEKSTDFRKKVIGLRTLEYFNGVIPAREELLRFLSLWEISL